MSGRIGMSGFTASARLPIRRGLVECISRSNTVPLKRTDIKPTAGASRSNNAGSGAKHPDEVVLEVRRLHEQHGVKKAEIVKMLSSKGVLITERDVYRYINYQTRGVLVPAQSAAPYL